VLFAPLIPFIWIFSSYDALVNIDLKRSRSSTGSNMRTTDAGRRDGCEVSFLKSNLPSSLGSFSLFSSS
jgi:hypothetical protein